MLSLTIPAGELWDEIHQEFVYTKECTLKLEHSLVSLSKWEAIYRKPYLSSEKNYEELIGYIKCMTITPNVDPNVYRCLTPIHIQTVQKYIDDTPTATWFSESNKKADRSVVTAEVIYYWMISNGISKEYEKWHLNRLLTLIRVFSEKNKPQKKMSRNDIYRRNSELNAERRRKLGSKG